MRHRFVMIMPQNMFGNLMWALTSQCSNELLSAGIGWWIAVQPETANAASCAKVSGWLVGEVAIMAKSEMFQNFAAAYTSETSLAFDYSSTYEGSGALTVLSAWNAALATVENCPSSCKNL